VSVLSLIAMAAEPHTLSIISTRAVTPGLRTGASVLVHLGHMRERDTVGAV